MDLYLSILNCKKVNKHKKLLQKKNLKKKQHVMNYLLHILDSLRLERKPGVVSLRVTKVEIKGVGG